MSDTPTDDIDLATIHRVGEEGGLSAMTRARLGDVPLAAVLCAFVTDRLEAIGDTESNAGRRLFLRAALTRVIGAEDPDAEAAAVLAEWTAAADTEATRAHEIIVRQIMGETPT